MKMLASSVLREDPAVVLPHAPSSPALVTFDVVQLEWAPHLHLLHVRLDLKFSMRPHALKLCRRLSPTVLDGVRLSSVVLPLTPASFLSGSGLFSTRVL